jgi:Siphovirus Gp157
MTSMEVLRLEAAHYRLIADDLKAEYSSIDDETLRDTMEGISELPQMIEELVRSSLDDEALIAGLKLRLDAMGERLSRIKDRHDKKRALAAHAMGLAGIPKIEVPDFGVSLCSGVPRLVISDPTKLPEAFLVPQPPKPDRAGISAALKAGTVIDGAGFEVGNPFIAVRAK